VLTGIVLVDALDQGVVPGTLGLLQDEWGFSDTVAGALPTAAVLAGFLVLVPAGWLADHARRTRLLTVVVASWALLSGLSAVAPSFLAFFGVRTLLGGASHVDNPVSSSLVADYYPPLARGRVYAVQRLTVVIGTGVGVGVGGLVGGALGWRWAYVVAAVPGLLVALVVARLREPARGALDRPGAIDGLDRTDGLDRIDGPPVALLEAIDDPAPRPGPGGLRAYLGEFRRVLDIRTIRSGSLGLAVTVLGIAGIAYWLPTFFERDFGLSAASAAALTAVAAITAGVVGALVGGTLGDRIEARRPGGRIALTAGAVVVGTLLAVTGFAVPVLPVTAGMVTVAATLLSIAFPNLAAVAAEVLPARRRGTGFAMFGFVLTLGSAAGPLVIGAVSQASGSLRWAMVAAVVPALPGALVIRRGGRTFAPDAAAAASGPA
jgi:MFS family permease